MYTVPVTLDTTDGEILFSKGPAVGGRIINGSDVQTYKPPNMMAGIRLTKTSIDALTEIRAQYGRRVESEETAYNDVMMVIHVPGSHEIPEGVYVYTSRSIYLLLAPPFLSLMGAFSLIPNVVQHTVHFTSGGCGDDIDSQTLSSDGIWNITSTGYQERIAQIHYQLNRALRPIGQLELRGALVRMSTTDQALMYGDYAVLNPSVGVDADGVVTFKDGGNTAEQPFQGRYSEAR